MPLTTSPHSTLDQIDLGMKTARYCRQAGSTVFTHPSTLILITWQKPRVETN